MALIDRGRVMVDYLENLGRNDSYKAKFEALCKAVDDAPAVDAMPCWISVEERLPERPGEVLVSIRKYTGLAFYHGGGKFETAGGMMFKAGDMLTHWMPKPKPAEEET